MSRKYNKVVNNFQESLTKQSFRDECDINNIIRKHAATGQCNHISARNPRYIDCVGTVDYQQALDIVDAAAAQFAALPSNLRARFRNDPALMLEFLADEKNVEEAAKLGLLKAAPEEPKKAQEEPKKAPEAKSQGSTPST